MLCLSGFELYARWVPLVMGKSFILVNVTFCLFVCFSGLFNDCLVDLFLPAPPTLQLMTPGTWISTEGYRPFKCESFTKTVRFVFCRLLALFGMYIYTFVATDNSLLQPPPKGAFPWLLWKSALLGTRLLRTSFDRSECRGTEVRDQTEIA